MQNITKDEEDEKSWEEAGWDQLLASLEEEPIEEEGEEEKEEEGEA
jgi:hypothetical protein